MFKDDVLDFHVSNDGVVVELQFNVFGCFGDGIAKITPCIDFSIAGGCHTYVMGCLLL